jgi:serine-type D-Ala-D-Ala carboxypeptidase (penicillin-binding protein 5/6)
MIRIMDSDNAATRWSGPRGLGIGLMVLTAFAITPARPAPAQTTGAAPKGQAAKSEPKTEKAERPVPPPEVVNAEKAPKQSPDPLDGPPYTTVKAWAIADGRTGEILWGHHEKDVLEPASTTKIMTALIVVRLMAKHPKVGNEIVTFSKRADRTVGSSSDVREGERVPVRELLYGLLLPSGNDAAVAFAEHFGGRLKPPADATKQDDPFARFIAEMNRVADELGLHETHFENPNGLPAPTHRSSARDLAKLAHHAMAEPTFAAVVATRKHGYALVNGDGNKRNVVWTNTNHLLDIEGYDGVKTGTTNAAGTCLVASGRRGSDHVIVVVLGGSNSPDSRYPDTRNLFRWAWHMRSRPSKTTGLISR